jgi:Holliday junction resolvasome RuvABC endonuclease subunit
MRAAETFFGIKLEDTDSDAADAMWVAIAAIRKLKEGK